MGFPGTISLSQETFERVLSEAIHSLMKHGFQRFLIYNGHGGNTRVLELMIYKINQTTSATAILLNQIEVPEDDSFQIIPSDLHAGIKETSNMLYLTPSLVDLTKAEKPVISFPEKMEQFDDHLESNVNLKKVINADYLSPKSTGKSTSTREITNTGVISSGNPKKATVERGRKYVERFIKASVEFIKAWKEVEP
jgi:creatinine amidohydrolase